MLSGRASAREHQKDPPDGHLDYMKSFLTFLFLPPHPPSSCHALGLPLPYSSTKCLFKGPGPVMDALTCTQKHSDWHSARAGCCRKGPLSRQPACWWVQQAARKSFSSSPGPHCLLRSALWTRLTWVPYSQASSKPLQVQPGWNWILHECAPTSRQDITWGRRGVCCSYRPPNTTLLVQRRWPRGRRKEERKEGSVLVAVVFGVDLTSKIIPIS